MAFDCPRFRGTSVLSRNQTDPADPWRLYPLAGGEPESAPWLSPKDVPVHWSDDGRYLFAYSPGGLPVSVERLDTSTGRREPWLELQPPDSASLTGFLGMEMTPDGRHYVYTYVRQPSELILVEGLR